MLENAAESHTSGARFVGRIVVPDTLTVKDLPAMSRQARQPLDYILQRTLTFTKTQKMQTYKHADDSETQSKLTKTLVL